MRRGAIVLVMVLAILVAAGALAAVITRAPGGVGGGGASAAGRDGIAVTTSLAPRLPLFGDTVRATVDVALDPSRVDEDSVRVSTAFSPWEVVGRPERTRRGVGETTYLRTVYTLRCTTGPCLPGGTTSAITLTPARVAFRRNAANGEPRGELPARWPLLVVYSRFAALRLDTGATTSYRADLTSLPAVSYLVSPRLLIGVLVGIASALAAAGAALVYVAWPRRAPTAPPEPEPEPQPSLSPLEQALALLEGSARAEGAGEQRRALELVAEELEEWGDDELSGAAKVLAWSAGSPRLEQTTELAARVRAELEHELLVRAALDRNGAESAT
ncbi:MAG: hypothetical protein R6W48_01180 [Gaiellaceae bacterium]